MIKIFQIKDLIYYIHFKIIKMFTYFPEYVFRTSKLYVNSTFPKLDTTIAKEIIQIQLKDEKFSYLLNEIKQKNLKLPTVLFSHCIDINSSISKYDRIENKIIFCLNKIDSYQQLLDLFIREMLYFYDNNIKFTKQNLSLNNAACTNIRSCRVQIENSINCTNTSLIEELTRRCCYSQGTLREDISALYENEDVFQISKDYIDNNMHRCFNMKEPFEKILMSRKKVVFDKVEKKDNKYKIYFTLNKI